MTNEIRNHEQSQPNARIKVRARVKTHAKAKHFVSKIVERTGTNRTCFVNQHGDFIQLATVKLNGKLVEVECFGMGATVYADK